MTNTSVVYDATGGETEIYSSDDESERSGSESNRSATPDVVKDEDELSSADDDSEPESNRSATPASEAINVRNAKVLVRKGKSECAWMSGCGKMVEHTEGGIGGHLRHEHGVYFEDQPLCCWGSCRHSDTFSTYRAFIKHIKYVHLKLDRNICPVCKNNLGGGKWALKIHIARMHPDFVSNGSKQVGEV